MVASQKKLSVIIPTYNEEENIQPLFERLVNVVSLLDMESVELVFVNDGSADNTLSAIKQLPQDKVTVKYIDLSRK